MGRLGNIFIPNEGEDTEEANKTYGKVKRIPRSSSKELEIIIKQQDHFSKGTWL